MAEKIIIKRMGQTMTQGTVGKWYIADGAAVEADQKVYELEYDKSTAPVQARTSGTLHHLVAEGASVPVGQPVGVILQPGETMDSVNLQTASQVAVAPTAPGGKAAPAPAAPASAPAAAGDADVIVIGGGPGGYVAANKLGMLGKSVILVERDRVGGTCLNRGCIPTKALLQCSEVYDHARHGDVWGVVANDMTVDPVKVDAFREKIVNGLVRGVESLLRARKVQTITGEASFTGPKTLEVKLAAGGTKTLTAENIIIATGSKNVAPPIPGLDGKNVVTSTEALHVSRLPESFVIIGGGVIGMELAVVYANLGVEVTVIEALPQLLNICDGEVSATCEQILSKKMDIFTSARVARIEDKGEKKVVYYTKDGKECAVEADLVLAALGRAPDTASLKLEKAGIKTEKTTIVVDDKLMTNVPGVYAIGDSNGIGMLAHVASAEGITVAEAICGKDAHINRDVVPSCIYCEPEIAQVGLTEEQVKASGRAYKVGKFPLRANGRSMIINQTQGFVKIIGDASTNEILGVHIIGPSATEMIGECAVAMKLEGCVEDIAQTIHAHPSVSESIMEAAESYLGGAIHSL